MDLPRGLIGPTRWERLLCDTLQTYKQIKEYSCILRNIQITQPAELNIKNRSRAAQATSQ